MASQKLGFRKGCNDVPKLGFRRGYISVPKLGFHGGPGFAKAQTCDLRQVCAVGATACSGVGRDRSSGTSRRCAVGSCPSNAAECTSKAAECASKTTDRVSRRTGACACGEQDNMEVQCDGSDGRHRVACAFFCWCSSDDAVLSAECGCFSLRHKVKTVQLLSTLIK